MSSLVLATLTGLVILSFLLMLLLLIYKVFQVVKLRRYRSSLKSKVVLITGASSGLGEALAYEYQKYGCQLVLCARRTDELKRVANNLSKISQSSKPIICRLDVTETHTLPTIIANKVLSRTKRIDILINNSGVFHKGLINETINEVFVRIMNVNYVGSVAITKAILPSMIQNQSGQIVFISSVASLISVPYLSAYSASKHAITAFADSLRAEMSINNINVSVIKPGFIRTDMDRNSLDANGQPTNQIDQSFQRGYSAAFIAKYVLDNVALKVNECLICPLQPWLAIQLRKYWPSMFFLVVRLMARNPNPDY